MKKTITDSKVASVAELKARLSEFLRVVKAGGEVVVTDRGVPVARLLPLAPDVAEESRLGRLAHTGLIREASRSVSPEVLNWRGPSDPEGRSLRIVLEERAGER